MRKGLGERIFGSVGVLLIILGMVNVALTVYLRIHEGRGAEAFQNAEGQILSWASAAGGIIAGSLMLLGGLLIAWWQVWRRSRLGRNSTNSRASNNRWRGP